jgi:predicted dehydrogenase
MKKFYNIGLIGTGGFGQFLIETYLHLKQAQVTAICSENQQQLRAIKAKYRIDRTFSQYQDLIQDSEIQIIVIATPPFLHYQMALDALNAGKHVLVEKPLALKIDEAKQLIRLAKKKNLRLMVDFELRYNPLILTLKETIKQNLFGQLKRVDMANYASDEHLASTHWFWDKELSGGIWVEHGVHFFDLFFWLLGEGKYRQGFSQGRNQKIRQDRVMAVLEYPKNILATFYHSFNRPYLLEKTTYDFIFSQGIIQLEGWIPIKMELQGLVDPKKCLILKKTWSSLGVKTKTNFIHTKKMAAKDWVSFSFTAGQKEKVYQQSLIRLMEDLIQSIEDKDFHPLVKAEDGLRALEMAIKVEQKSLKLTD